MRHHILIGSLIALVGLVAPWHVNAGRDDPPGGQPLVLWLHGTNAAQEILPLDQATPDAVPLTDLGLVSVSTQVSSSHPAPLASAVAFAGQVYDVRAEGVYRFMLMPQPGASPGSLQNLISVANLDTRDSLMALVAGMARLHVHGVRHESDTNLVRTMQQTGWTALRCDPIAALGMQLLTTLGFNSHMVSAMTLDTPNGYDDGHTMLEVLLPDSQTWMAVDLDLGTVFQDPGTDAYLSATEIQQAALNGQSPQITRLGGLAIDYDFVVDGFDYTPWAKWRFATDEALWSWYRRVWQQLN
jgi:hypothetical protein